MLGKADEEIILSFKHTLTHQKEKEENTKNASMQTFPNLMIKEVSSKSSQIMILILTN